MRMIVAPLRHGCGCKALTNLALRGLRSRSRARFAKKVKTKHPIVIKAGPGVATALDESAWQHPAAEEEEEEIIQPSPAVNRDTAGNPVQPTWTEDDLQNPEFLETLLRVPEPYHDPSGDWTEEDGTVTNEEWAEAGSGEKDPVKEYLVGMAQPLPLPTTIFGQELLERWSKVLRKRSTPQLKQALQRLKLMEEKSRKDSKHYKATPIGFQHIPQGSTGESLEYGPMETYAYVAHRMLRNYSIVHAALSEVRRLSAGWSPCSLLDFGSGPGTAILAAREAFGTELNHIHRVERSQAMLDASNMLLEGLQEQEVRLLTSRSIISARNALAGSTVNKYDLVVACFGLAELKDSKLRAAVTALMWDMVAPGGMLLVVEDGDELGSHTVRSVRELVLKGVTVPAVAAPRPSSGSKGNRRHRHRGKGKEHVQKRSWLREQDRPDQEGTHQASASATVPTIARIVAPCRHHGACPLAVDRIEPCRFRAVVPSYESIKRSLTPSAGAHYSYVAIKKEPKEEAGAEQLQPQQQPGAIEGFAAASIATETSVNETLRDLDPARVLDGWGRLVRPPLKSKGHVTMDICTPTGELTRTVVSRKKVAHIRGFYNASRKSRLGGLWPVT
ncbi:unnamed protein product [Chrysoparadoxa australica]